MGMLESTLLLIYRTGAALTAAGPSLLRTDRSAALSPDSWSSGIDVVQPDGRARWQAGRAGRGGTRLKGIQGELSFMPTSGRAEGQQDAMDGDDMSESFDSDELPDTSDESFSGDDEEDDG